EASWIRIEATLLSSRAYDGQYNLQFSEILIYSGHHNVALSGTVRISSEQRAGSGGWHKDNLINGYLPYFMDAAEGEKSLAFVSEHQLGNAPTISFDLEATHEIDRIHLHTVEQGDTVPQAFPGDFGIPRWLQMQGANQADFSDAEVFFEFRVRNSMNIAPIMEFPFKPSTYRYLRFIAKEPYFLEGFRDDGTPMEIGRIGFAEIEVFSGDTNVALAKTPRASFDATPIDRNINALTDGRNFYGNILPLRVWMTQLAKRHDLEIERPMIELELENRYNRQEGRLRVLSWIIAALFVGTVLFYLTNRFLRQRAIFNLRNRIAADLHDELGANLHAVSMLGELASNAKEDPEKMGGLVERMRNLTQRTSEAVKYCTNILETPGLYEDFEDAMIRNADRLLSDLNHKLVFEAEDTITKMRAGKRIDLFLFYKECLINIIRHSGATEVETKLKTEGKKLHLQVSDNGSGFENSTENHIPVSLKRRAKLLGGKVAIENAQTGGAEIHLFMQI
ncbi:MAG: histidine kinase, partial [Opitutales bacterium]|nr:histidine kinase [Opitutales bacterium]